MASDVVNDFLCLLVISILYFSQETVNFTNIVIVWVFGCLVLDFFTVVLYITGINTPSDV